MKKIQEQLSPEEQAIESFLLQNKLELIPGPNRFFGGGESVEIGSLHDCVISKSLFDGKAYLIDYTSSDNRYSGGSKPTTTKNVLGVWSWLNIFKISDKKESLIKNEDLYINYSQTGIHSIISNIYFFGIDMNPEYQRDYVWTKEDQENLIDSIFQNIDIGKFVFVRLPFKSNSPTYEILDGKQRIKAIKDFYEDRLLYKGFKFSELSKKDRGFFDNYHVSVCEVADCSQKQKLRIFYHINISGKVMGKKHLEKIKKMIESEERKEKK